MIENIPHIHLFEMYNKKYFYDVNTNGMMSIPDGVFCFFQKLLGLPVNSQDKKKALYQELSPEEKKDIDFLVAQGYLKGVKNNVKIQHAETNRLDAMYRNNLNIITLQVTQNCNLRCKYCVYSGSYINRIHNNKRMSLETAIGAIDFLHNNSLYSDSVAIGFYGGEPLLEYELIQACVKHAEDIFAGKTLNFNMTTNATLLDEDKIKFLEKHKFSLTISLDGPRDVQNRNRIFAGSNKGTYDTIMEKLELVKSICPGYIKNITFNAVIDLTHDISCTSEYFMSYDLVKEIGVSGNFVESGNLKDGEDLDSIPPEYMAHSKYEVFKTYLDSCSDLLEGYQSSLYSFHLSYLNNQMEERIVVNNHENCIDCPGGQCLPGIQRLFVSVDGKLFPCERINESADVLCIGNIKEGFNVDNAKALLNVAQITEDECSRCWCYKLCEQCCGKAEKDGKLDKSRRLSFCSGTKLMAEESFKDYITLKKYKSKLI